jgi:tetratricopeptide (TPR) repeat protein
MMVMRQRLHPADFLRQAAETLLLLSVTICPWLFASVPAPYEVLLFATVALVALLATINAIVTRGFRIRIDLMTLLFVAFIAHSLLQIAPLPSSILNFLSPARAQTDHTLRPSLRELIPGEADSYSENASTLAITNDRNLTWLHTIRLTGLFVIYLVVRNWIASRDAFIRFAWVLAFNGVALAIFGIAQNFSSHQDTVFWSVRTYGSVFGPFICRNHYPDYVLFCLGLGIAILVTRSEPKKSRNRPIEYQLNIWTRLSDSPHLVTLGLGLFLVAISIPMSLSRGGMLGAVVAATSIAAIYGTIRGRIASPLAIGAIVFVVGAVLGGWLFGWASVSDRLSTLGESDAGQNRTVIWNDILRGVPSYLVMGGGNGALLRFEPLHRVSYRTTSTIIDYAHNEYIEALAEGGLIRLGITIVFCGAIIATVIRAYRRLQDRSSGPLVLGAGFGLLALIAHSVVDFGIHIPSIAFLAVIVLAYVNNAVTDPGYVPVRKGESSPEPDRRVRSLKGMPAIVIMGIMALASIACLVTMARHAETQELIVAARNAYRYSLPDHLSLRREFLERATLVSPNDPDAWLELAILRFEQARMDYRMACAAGMGLPSVITITEDVAILPHNDALRDAMAAARRARDLQPLMPEPHIFLAQGHAVMTVKDTPRQYLDRAVLCAPTDAQLYTYRGIEAIRRGDSKAAFADWTRAMSLSRQQIDAILKMAKGMLTSEQILREVLPAEPLVIRTALEQLYPFWTTSDPTLRRPYLEAIIALDGRSDWPGRDWEAIALANAELRNDSDAERTWLKALEKEPRSHDIRNRFAAWLEETERYPTAEEQLNYLRDNGASSQDILRRIEVVRHARRLEQILSSQ